MGEEIYESKGEKGMRKEEAEEVHSGEIGELGRKRNEEHTSKDRK